MVSWLGCPWLVVLHEASTTCALRVSTKYASRALLCVAPALKTKEKSA